MAHRNLPAQAEPFYKGNHELKQVKEGQKKKKKTALREIFLHHSEERHSLPNDI